MSKLKPSDEQIIEKCVNDGFCKFIHEGEGGYILLVSIKKL